MNTDPTAVGFDRLRANYQEAFLLGANVLRLSQEISVASSAALQAANPALADTDLGVSWPLANQFSMLRMIADLTIGSIRSHGVPREEQTSPYVAELLTRDSYRDDELIAAYGTHQPRRQFVLDMVRWADGMAKGLWPVLVDMQMYEGHRIKVRVHEGSESNKAKMIGNGNLITDEEIATGASRDVWVSDRVVISGNEELGRSIEAAQ